MKEPCNGLFGQLFGHKYQPRYSRSAPTVASMSGCDAEEGAAVLEASKRQTYICDVCARSGAVARHAPTGKAP